MKKTLAVLALMCNLTAWGQSRPANDPQSLVDFLNYIKSEKKKLGQKLEIVYSKSLVKRLADPVTIQYEMLNPDTAIVRVFRQQRKLMDTLTAPNTMAVKEKNEKPSVPRHFSPSYFTVRGRITNEKGEPLGNASVFIKEKKAGTEANSDGSFSIKCCRGDRLAISYVGYKEKEIIVTGNDSLKITLERNDAGNCDATVVNGYRPVDPLLNTTSTSTVKFDEQPVTTSVLSLIQGQVPGMNVISS